MSQPVMFQTGTINGVLKCIYDGDLTMSQVSAHGDFGLGSLDAIDGELIVVDGTFYRADRDGALTVINPAAKTPFAVVTHLQKSEKVITIDSPTSLAILQEICQKEFTSKNLMYAIRIDGEFSDITLRSESCQPRPYRPLSETLPSVQNIYSRQNVSGTLVGVWFPDYMSNLNVPGFHFHFVDDKKEIGGHVFECTVTKGTLIIQEHHDLNMHLINSTEFHEVDFSAQDQTNSTLGKLRGKN